MTDNEIIKALQCCRYGGGCGDGCPYHGADGCNPAMFNDAIDLINRQKAEIEGYKHLDVIAHMGIDEFAAKLKSKAIKEFAERLKEQTTAAISCNTYTEVVRKSDIDNLLKEMVGEDNG